MGVLNTTPRTWVASEIVTAAEMNAEIHDPFTAIQAAWTTYTPTLTGLTLGTGSSTVARYRQVGKTIDFFIQVTLGTGGAATGSITATLPVTALFMSWFARDCNGFHSATPATFDLVGVATSTAVLTIRVPGAGAAAITATNATAPFTWASGDILTVQGRYEAA